MAEAQHMGMRMAGRMAEAQHSGMRVAEAQHTRMKHWVLLWDVRTAEHIGFPHARCVAVAS